LAQARASTVTTPTTEPDTGFNPKLPFGPRTSQQLVNVPGASQLAGGANLGGDQAERRQHTFEYIAGALVLLMLAMHALFLRTQVARAALLDTLEPVLPAES
jgi:hypothetical protein